MKETDSEWKEKKDQESKENTALKVQFVTWTLACFT